MTAAAPGGVPRFTHSFPHMVSMGTPIGSYAHSVFAVDLGRPYRDAPSSGPLSSASAPSLGVARSIYFHASSHAQDSRPPRVRRTFKELFRELECPHETCSRRYASRSSLATHVRLKHSPEAKQQHEDAKQQRKKSMEKTVTFRPVRPRAHSLASADVLYRHSTGSMMPLQFTPHIGTSAPTSAPALLQQTWTPAMASRLHSPSLDSLVLQAQSSMPPQLTRGGHGAPQCVLPYTDPLSFASPYGPRGGSASTVSTASTRPNSAGSLSMSNFSSPAMTMHNFCSGSSDNLAQPIQGMAWNDMLLSNFELGLDSTDRPAMRMSSVKSEPILQHRRSAEVDDKDMHEMHMLLSGLQSSAASAESMMTDTSDQLETISETALPHAA